MSDLNMNFEKLNKACKEVNETWREMMNENNPFDTISKIAKDIRDREDKELALAFTNIVGSLLRDNGVFVKTSRYELETDNETDKNKYIIKKEYGVSFDGLDFTEHDKVFEDKIELLNRNLNLQKDKRCEEEIERNYLAERFNQLKDENDELKQRIAELERKNNQLTESILRKATKIHELEIKEAVDLPFDPLETANMLINATYKAEIPFLEKQVDRNVYDIDDLEQIAEHLLVYCKHNKESE